MIRLAFASRAAVNEIGEPSGIGVREETLRARRKQTAGKMDDHVDPG